MGINSSRKLGIVSAVALLVSGMIGSAIFSMSGLTICYAGPASIISWILAALIQLFYGLAMAELAIVYKKNGGVFVFPEATFGGKIGKLLGFLSAWGCLMADVIAVAFSSMYVGRYLSASFSGLGDYIGIISILSILLCLVLNIINFSTTGKINTVLAIALGALLLLYSFLVLKSDSFTLQNMQPFFTQGAEGTFGFLKAVPIAMIAYSSIMSVSFMAGEVDEPNRNIPKAVCIGMFIVVSIYTLVMLATVGVISASELGESDAVYIPLFQVCFTKLSSIGWLARLISIAASIALITTMLVVIAMSGRNLKAIADKELLPKVFSKEGKTSTPAFSLLIVCIFGMILSQFQSITEILINLGALFAIVTIAINFIVLLYMRRKRGKAKEFTAPLSNSFVIIVLIVMVSCYIPDIINGGKALWIFSISWYIIGYIIYKVMYARA